MRPFSWVRPVVLVFAMFLRIYFLSLFRLFVHKDNLVPYLMQHKPKQEDAAVVYPDVDVVGDGYEVLFSIGLLFIIPLWKTRYELVELFLSPNLTVSEAIS